MDTHKLHSVKSQTDMKNGLTLVEVAQAEQCVVFHNGIDSGYHEYGNNWWTNQQCPFAYKYLTLDSMYPDQYFGEGIGHPDFTMASDLYTYMQHVFNALFHRNFNSVIELGTGAGEITTRFAANGLDYLAVEGTSSGVQKLLYYGIDEKRICRDNLKFLKFQGRQFDIAMCTEVAEHLEPFFASKIVDNCIKHSEVVWFSAADPNRPAHYHHMNELHIEAWDNLFSHMGHNFIIKLNGLHGRATRLYLSQRLGLALKIYSQDQKLW